MEPTQAWKPIKPPVVRFLHLTPARSSHSSRLTVTLQEPDQLFIRLAFVDGTDFQGFNY